jgi:hypothetical protein
MHRLVAGLAAACAVAGTAAAQFTTQGQVVGSSVGLNPSGTAVPRAVPQAGNPVGNPLGRPYDPTRPLDVFKGTNLDPKSVVAPVSGFPSVPTQQPDLLDKLYAKIGSITHFFSPTPPAQQPAPTVTPGIFRRNRERAAERMWRRD